MSNKAIQAIADKLDSIQATFERGFKSLRLVQTADDEARWVTVGGGTNVETGEGTGRRFQIDSETGKILKGGGAAMKGKTFKEAFSDDNKTLTERQKLSRRITAHATKQHGGDPKDFTRLTNKGAAGKSSDWHAKEFLKSGNVPSEYQEQAQASAGNAPSEWRGQKPARDRKKESKSGNESPELKNWRTKLDKISKKPQSPSKTAEMIIHLNSEQLFGRTAMSKYGSFNSQKEREFVEGLVWKRKITDRQNAWLSDIAKRFRVEHAISESQTRLSAMQKINQKEQEQEPDMPMQRDDGSWYDAETGLDITNPKWQKRYL